VKPSKRQYAVQDNQVEHVQVGAAEDLSASQILDLMSSESSDQTRNVMSKKAKQTLKHDLFLERLESARSPYSKSHARRLKRKAKEQIGGGMNDIKAAITEMEDDPAPEPAQESMQKSAGVQSSANEPRIKSTPGRIGEGQKNPLTKAQRKKVLQLEKKRHPMILGNVAYASNPFETIRTHAQNTLVKHQSPQ